MAQMSTMEKAANAYVVTFTETHRKQAHPVRLPLKRIRRKAVGFEAPYRIELLGRLAGSST